MKYIIALFTLFVVVSAGKQPFDHDLNVHWETFKKAYNKTYSAKEESARRLIWEKNVHENFQHNLEADMGLHSFKTGINEYSDLTHEEFFASMTGLVYTPNHKMNGSTWVTPSNVDIPPRVDWREKGLVTPVKNQRNCGSCWAFATTGALEGQNKKKTGRLISLSEQNLVDCSRRQGNAGCNGGFMDHAYHYIMINNGIDTEASYPYTARDEACRFRRDTVGATCSGFVKIPQGNEDALLYAVATVGPVAVAMDADHVEFMRYKSGIFDLPSCRSWSVNHAVLIVGYGSEYGRDYWLVKNSWGTSWGMNGYIKMSRNRNNQCGIASYASFPLV